MFVPVVSVVAGEVGAPNGVQSRKFSSAGVGGSQMTGPSVGGGRSQSGGRVSRIMGVLEISRGGGSSGRSKGGKRALGGSVGAAAANTSRGVPFLLLLIP